MTSLHEELERILNEEKIILGSLYDVVSAERDAIVSLDSEKLMNILMQKEELLMKLSIWEKEREKLLKSHNLEKFSLRELIEFFEKNDNLKDNNLRKIYEGMRIILDSIAEIQRINEQLIDRSIIHVGTALKFLESFGITARQSFKKEA